jgi:NAD(P)H dehydrogenase (quinone)
MIGHGVPADQANMLLGMFHAARRGEFSTTGPELENLLQRAATPVRSMLAGLATQP